MLWNKDKALEVLDPRMKNSYVESQVLRWVQVGLLCVQKLPTERPTMSSVVLGVYFQIFATMTSPTHHLMGRFGPNNGPNLLTGQTGRTLKIMSSSRSICNGLWVGQVSLRTKLNRSVTVPIRHPGRLAGPTQISSSRI